MKIGVLSDIHGNVWALKECLKYLEKENADAYFFLGDYIGELPAVQECIDIIRNLAKEKRCYIIKGNKEEYLLKGICEGHTEWDEYKSVVGMLRYSASSINYETKSFLCNLPISMVIKFDGHKEILICHGSPNGCRIPVISHKNGLNTELLGDINQEYIIHGHTHYQEKMDYDGKHIWNAGTVGLQCNGKTETQFMLLTSEGQEWIPKFISLKYDYEAVVADMHKKNLYEIAPYWARATESLITGKNRVENGKMLMKAMELCSQAEGSCIWPQIPEKYMKAAFEALGGSY